jgi:hypothetical protein
LKDLLLKLDVLAFDIRKYGGHNGKPYFAILTIPSASNGEQFLQRYGSQGRRAARQPLEFQGQRLEFRLNNKPGQFDPLKIKSLQEKEEAERLKIGSQAPIMKLERPSGRSTLSFHTLMTGVWNYNHLGKLVFDQKFKDGRKGFITFGKSALVVSMFSEIVYNAKSMLTDLSRYTSKHVLPSPSTGTAESTFPTQS